MFYQIMAQRTINILDKTDMADEALNKFFLDQFDGYKKVGKAEEASKQEGDGLAPNTAAQDNEGGVDEKPKEGEGEEFEFDVMKMVREQFNVFRCIGKCLTVL